MKRMAVYRETDGSLVREYQIEQHPILQRDTGRAHLDIVPTKEYGQALFLDGELQFTEKDEYIYHEALVHPCLSLTPGRKKVCILGGGDGCAAREVLKWGNEIESIDLIDWDAELTGLFKSKYSALNERSLQHPLIKIENRNIRECLHEYRSYDIIFIDLLDPNPTKHYEIDLWYDIFFLAKHWIKDTGSIVINAGGLTPWNTKEVEWLLDLAQEKCPCPIRLYKTFVPSFGREWCFLLLTHQSTSSLQNLPQGLRFLDTTTWTQMCSWSRDYRDGPLGLNI